MTSLIGTWCTLCLIGAAATLIRIPYSLDEIVATLQFLKKRRQAGRPLLYVLFRGDTIAGGSADYADHFEATPETLIREMLRLGVTIPWTLATSAAIGVALMCSGLLLGTTGEAADNDHVTGALIITASVIAMGQVARPLRFVNIAFGLWLIMSPLLFGGYPRHCECCSRTVRYRTDLAGVSAWLDHQPLPRMGSPHPAWAELARILRSVTH